MSSLVLKIIACTTMLIAHIGYVFGYCMPPWLGDALYLIGRISFPVFAFLITEGWIHTRSKLRYLRNLLLFAFVSQLPYMLAFDKSNLNVLFTLSLGALTLWIENKMYDKEKNCYTPLVLLSVLPVLIPLFFHMEYGWEGVMLVALLGLTCNIKIKAVIMVLSMALIYLPMEAVIYKLAFPFATLAVFPILLYNGKPGKVRLKYLFYGFYPAHLLILYCIYRFVC